MYKADYKNEKVAIIQEDNNKSSLVSRLMKYAKLEAPTEETNTNIKERKDSKRYENL